MTDVSDWGWVVASQIGPGQYQPLSLHPGSKVASRDAVARRTQSGIDHVVFGDWEPEMRSREMEAAIDRIRAQIMGAIGRQ